MLPKINQYVYIQVESMDEEESQHTYKSRIADVKPTTFAIEVPISEKTGRLKRLFKGDHLSAHLITADGVKNYFNTTVVGFREDTIRQVIIQRPDPETITKVQRRNYLRVPAELELAVEMADQFHFVTSTEDISGGGLSFICEGNYSLKTKDVISCWVLLNFKNDIVEHANFKGELLRVKVLETGRQLVMMSFTEIRNADREKIIRYCFERQLELRKV